MKAQTPEYNNNAYNPAKVKVLIIKKNTKLVTKKYVKLKYRNEALYFLSILIYFWHLW